MSNVVSSGASNVSTRNTKRKKQQPQQPNHRVQKQKWAWATPQRLRTCATCVYAPKTVNALNHKMRLKNWVANRHWNWQDTQVKHSHITCAALCFSDFCTSTEINEMSNATQRNAANSGTDNFYSSHIQFNSCRRYHFNDFVSWNSNSSKHITCTRS